MGRVSEIAAELAALGLAASTPEPDHQEAAPPESERPPGPDSDPDQEVDF